ncbi:hypothetical protein Moror_17596 [Moniliophthora roreri MCA 2997]|nr:hypothetical protein Moror_17596 [Moniliophthora roreri MCA 2997]
MSSASSGVSQRTGSISPRLSPSPRIRRRTVNGKLTINVFGSSTDLPANTPISSYVRRKTPMASPTSPTFSRNGSEEVIPAYPMPFTLPTLPAFLPGSANSESFPITPDSELEDFSSTRMSPKHSPKLLSDDVEIKQHLPRSTRLHTGIRISTSPRSTASSNTSCHSVQVA